MSNEQEFEFDNLMLEYPLRKAHKYRAFIKDEDTRWYELDFKRVLNDTKEITCESCEDILILEVEEINDLLKEELKYLNTPEDIYDLLSLINTKLSKLDKNTGEYKSLEKEFNYLKYIYERMYSKFKHFDYSKPLYDTPENYIIESSLKTYLITRNVNDLDLDEALQRNIVSPITE